MKNSFRASALMACAALAAAALAGPASAHIVTPLYSDDFSHLGALESPGSFSTSFAAGAGSGTLEFELQGYATLDGDNYWIDVFHLSINNQEVLSGTFDLGGGAGGTDRLLAAPTGTLAVRGGPQLYEFILPVTLVGGTNTITFSYDSPLNFEGTSRAGPQGLGDEGWGINRVQVSAVPEPQTWALLLAGIGCVALARRASQKRQRKLAPIPARR